MENNVSIKPGDIFKNIKSRTWAEFVRIDAVEEGLVFFRHIDGGIRMSVLKAPFLQAFEPSPGMGARPQAEVVPV